MTNRSGEGKLYPVIPGSPTGEEDTVAQPVPMDEPETEGKWQWIGDSHRPEAQESSDGISDLFTVSDEDIGVGADIDDLVEVDMDSNIIDAGEDGTLDDLVNVTEEDIMGEDYGQPPSRKYRTAPRQRITRQQPPTSMGGMR